MGVAAYTITAGSPNQTSGMTFVKNLFLGFLFEMAAIFRLIVRLRWPFWVVWLGLVLQAFLGLLPWDMMLWIQGSITLVPQITIDCP